MPAAPTDAWFADLPSAAVDRAAERIRTGGTDAPAEWPTRAIEAGFAEDEAAYFELLQAAATRAVEAELAEAAAAEDRHIVHAIRALDDLDRITNELSERVTEWAGSLDRDVPAGEAGVAAAAQLSADSALDGQLVALAEQVQELEGQRVELEATIERTMRSVAPNLSALAGPLLGARLIALAGDLERLAKLPSGTVQVLGAEDALFAHLHGQASSPKHGVIYTHEYVRGTPPDQRGSAARAVAGKLAIAARIDHYAGDRRPSLQAELDERIERIRGRD